MLEPWNYLFWSTPAYEPLPTVPPYEPPPVTNNTQHCDHSRVTETAVDLELCITNAVIKANQMVATDGSTTLERYSGLSVDPNWKTGDELVAFRPLVDLAALNSVIVRPPSLGIVCPPSWLINVTSYQQTNPVHRLVPAVTCVRNRYLNADGICKLKFFRAFTKQMSNFIVRCTAINSLRLWNGRAALRLLRVTT